MVDEEMILINTLEHILQLMRNPQKVKKEHNGTKETAVLHLS